MSTSGIRNRKMRRGGRLAVLALLCLTAVPGCRPQARGIAPPSATADNCRTVQYADGFTISRHGASTLIEVRDPWDTLRTLSRYQLYRDSLPGPERLQDAVPVRIPVARVACESGTDAGVLQLLGKGGTVVALADADYVADPELAAGIRAGRIISLGPQARLNVEALLTCQPDLLIATPYKGSPSAAAHVSGVPVVQCTSYMERTPLGRAEWIRFFAAFYGLDALADSLFNAVADRYLTLSQQVQHLTEHPAVFSELKYGQTWPVPGGQSYMGRIFRDAGLDYIWRDDPSAGSLMLSFETILDRAAEADYWIVKYNRNGETLTYSLLAEEYPPYALFRAFREKHIIVCNTAVRPYFEQGPMQPDVVLADLVHLTHPDALPDHTPVFFEMLAE